jgi:hypothetical protein
MNTNIIEFMGRGNILFVSALAPLAQKLFSDKKVPEAYERSYTSQSSPGTT